MFYLKIRGGTTMISNAINLCYLCENCVKWFRPDVIVSIYTYPESVLVATVSGCRICFHCQGGCS